MNFKNLPRWALTNQQLEEDVREIIEKEYQNATSSEIDDKVDQVLKKAGFFHGKNRDGSVPTEEDVKHGN